MPQPSRKLRLVVPLFVGGLALLIVLLVATGEGGANKVQIQRDAPSKATDTTTAAEPSTTEAETPEAEPSAQPADTTTTADASAPASEPAKAPVAPETAERSLESLRLATHPVADDEPEQTLGDLDDPDQWAMELYFTREGAGVSHIPFSNIWQTAAARRQAAAYFSARTRGDTTGYSLPPEEDRYVLLNEHPVSWVNPEGERRERVISILSARSVEINGTTFDLTVAAHWQQTEPGSFTATVLNEDDEPVARIHRVWKLGSGYDVTLSQSFENLTTEPLRIVWAQYGPPSLIPDRSRYMDRRRFRFGYEYPESFDPNHVADVIAEGDMVMELTDASDLEQNQFWPNELSESEGYTLSWFASTNRYFGLAVHPVLGPDGQGSRSLAPLVESIGKWVQGTEQDRLIFSTLISPTIEVAPGTTHDLSMGVFAGPLERRLLEDEQPYVALNMRGLILYQMSAWCAICTFQWLADILIVVLAFLDAYILFDWGLAIIGLVVIVRTLMHPITKKSQVGMQRFTRTMGKLKPQMEKINQKYKDDPKRKQQEQMKLMQEHGVNPLQMLGCLPLFLQMPIWIALYAVLYFAFELRQEPAFWGVFQLLWDWPFLADLSSPDHFFGEFDEPVSFLFWNLTGLNLLPILLGVLFFVQQKYMTPPTTTLTPEQEAQQKIMRTMMIVLFPLMLYSAPSGLTLYILTSSSIGIIESRHIRRQVDREDEDTEVVQRPTPAKKKVKDPQGRAYAKMLERRKSEAKKKQSKTFKKRK